MGKGFVVLDFECALSHTVSFTPNPIGRYRLRARLRRLISNPRSTSDPTRRPRPVRRFVAGSICRRAERAWCRPGGRTHEHRSDNAGRHPSRREQRRACGRARGDLDRSGTTKRSGRDCYPRSGVTTSRRSDREQCRTGDRSGATDRRPDRGHRRTGDRRCAPSRRADRRQRRIGNCCCATSGSADRQQCRTGDRRGTTSHRSGRRQLCASSRYRAAGRRADRKRCRTSDRRCTTGRRSDRKHYRTSALRHAADRRSDNGCGRASDRRRAASRRSGR